MPFVEIGFAGRDISIHVGLDYCGSNWYDSEAHWMSDWKTVGLTVGVMIDECRLLERTLAGFAIGLGILRPCLRNCTAVEPLNSNKRNCTHTSELKIGGSKDACKGILYYGNIEELAVCKTNYLLVGFPLRAFRCP